MCRGTFRHHCLPVPSGSTYTSRPEPLSLNVTSSYPVSWLWCHRPTKGDADGLSSMSGAGGSLSSLSLHDVVANPIVSNATVMSHSGNLNKHLFIKMCFKLLQRSPLAKFVIKKKSVERCSVYRNGGIAKRQTQDKQSTPTPCRYIATPYAERIDDKHERFDSLILCVEKIGDFPLQDKARNAFVNKKSGRISMRSPNAKLVLKSFKTKWSAKRKLK